MAKTVKVTFKLDAKVKKSMERVCSELGLSINTAFRIFAKKVARESQIPFEVSADPFYSKENMLRLRKSIEQLETSGGKIHNVNLDD